MPGGVGSNVISSGIARSVLGKECFIGKGDSADGISGGCCDVCVGVDASLYGATVGVEDVKLLVFDASFTINVVFGSVIYRWVLSIPLINMKCPWPQILTWEIVGL